MDTNGVEIDADAHGDYLAFSCPACEYPVLAVALENQRGSDEKHPAKCNGCGTPYFLDIRPQAQKLYIHDV